MIIRKISCEQFAGIRDREVGFEDGLNLIIGDNETGKSTLVDLIYSLFFQKAALDKRKDKLFEARYFPSTTGKYAGDVIDGTIRFETEEGLYKLTKEWSGRNSASKLTTPEGTVIRDADMIGSILEEQLRFGRGVFDELVFASQKRSQNALASLFGEKTSDSMEEVASVISRAVMETGGVDVDEIERELAEKAAEYEGRWDFSMNMPEGGRKRGIQNKWKAGCGSIVNAYYEKEEIAAMQKAAEDGEKELESINRRISEEQELLRNAEAELDGFTKIFALISEKSNHEKILRTAMNAHTEMRRALKEWPVCKENLAKAAELQRLHSLAIKRERYHTIEQLVKECDILRARLEKTGDVDEADCERAAAYESDVRDLEGKLRGINLAATIKKLGTEDIRVVSAVTGEPLEPENGNVDISEAVRILIPGIAEIDLAPKGIDAAEIASRLQDAKADFARIAEKYGVSSASELQRKKKDAEEIEKEIREIRIKIDGKLMGEEWDAVKAEAENIPDSIPDSTRLQTEIRELCGNSIEAYIGRMTAETDRYTGSYGSIEALQREAEKKEQEIDALRHKLDEAADIPQKYAGITDPEEYRDRIDIRIKEQRRNIEDTRRMLSEAERNLGEKSAEEYSEEYAKANEVFERLRTEHRHWKKIREVFAAVKENYRGDPMGDIERYFREYLSELTDGGLCLESIGEDLSSTMTSGNSRLTGEILSEGTKETVSLAFRLAMLRHLYPEGGCVAVFDDPFTDMDPRRTQKACKVLQRFAENNQVIFVTCDEKYRNLLNSTCILLNKVL